MAIEFNITAADKFFLGEDKVIDITVLAADGVTPYNIVGLPLEWNLRKKDSASDPALITKVPTVTGVFNANPAVNTQKAHIVIASDDTDPLVTVGLATPYKLKAGFAYRHSLKRKDAGNETIASYGSVTFLQATER